MDGNHETTQDYARNYWQKVKPWYVKFIVYILSILLISQMLFCQTRKIIFKKAKIKNFLLQAGFFLVQYAHLWQQHLDNLVHLFSVGKLKVLSTNLLFFGRT